MALARDPDVMEKSGQVLTVGDLAREYGFTDIDGRQPPGYYPKEGVFTPRRGFELQAPGLSAAERLLPEELKAIAESGGYIGLYAVPFFYPKEDRTLNHLLDEIDHAVNVAGIDHIGLGIDYGGQGGPWSKEITNAFQEIMKTRWAETGFRPEHGVDPSLATKGIDDFTKWPNITRGLVSRGYSNQDIQKILGENFLRVFEKVVG